MSHADRRLADVLAHQIEEEREQAIRALLMRPLLTEGNPEMPLVRRHGEYLREWFQRETGWVLHVERECARLYKRPASHEDATRGLRKFDREHYVLLCLTCAVLERADTQITLRALGERLLEAVLDTELAARNFSFTLETTRERRVLVNVCRFLLEFGVITRVAGDEEGYVTQAGDALYDIHRRVLASLPASTRGASLIAAGENAPGTLEERIRALTEEFVADSPEARRTAARHRIARRLLDDPVTYYDELVEEERAYLATQRGPMSARLAQGAGLTPELRAEGLALIDPEGELSDERMPAVGTEAHITLIIAERLAAAARIDAERIHSMHELETFLREAVDQYGKYWRKDAREHGAVRGLVEQAIDRLEALKLVWRVSGEGVKVRAALLRFAVGPPEVRVAPEVAR
ncbi:TIGR02678 family protein [Steroidobacter sp. S1-65]|uniref:TIGR02678 family protein n=1 Tax=Steroidobacter gossypii TaxID=2805490 RepID=A0ABS1WX64_9GAMM|nr:TIGR02678 family protein [Steroidobacter gossypii]MBM0105553.1 TIGR02678 family protein [Steroidobacter gossypii]